MKKEKILITGAGGTLGKTIIKKLKEENFEFLSLVKKKQTGIKNSIQCDITYFDSLKKKIHKFKPTIIIHLAGLTGNLECEEKEELAFQTIVLGTYNVLRCCRKNKVKIIFASSREVYGDIKFKANENNKLQPKNINGITKMLSENLILNFNQQYKIPYTILRFTNFYGENYSKRGISKMIKIAMQGGKISLYGGKQMIDLIHHDDAAISILKAIRMNKSGIYNIGSGKSVTIDCLLQQIEKICNKKIKIKKYPRRNFEVKKCRINNSKAKLDMKFKARLELEGILKLMHVKWSV